MNALRQADQLTALARKLPNSRELSEELVLDVLKYCSAVAFDDVPKKYELISLCEIGAWTEAAVWVTRACFPTWTLEAEFGQKGGRARLSSPHAPPLIAERVHASVPTAILTAVANATLGVWKLGKYAPAR